MAKQKPDLSNIFAKTETPKVTSDLDLDQGNIRAVGIGLRGGEVAGLDAVAQALTEHLGCAPLARNAIGRLAIRRFLEGWQAGDITLDDLAEHFNLPDKPQPKLKF
jgi:hypothetical protein